MCYLIAKKYNKPGCYSVEVERGPELAKLVSTLGKQLVEKDIEILTVFNIDAYGEYKPYHILGSEEEFISKVMAM